MASKNSKKATASKEARAPTVKAPEAPEEARRVTRMEHHPPEIAQADAAVDASREKDLRKLPKDQPIEVVLRIPGYIPEACRTVSMADLRNDVRGDKVIRELLADLTAQF